MTTWTCNGKYPGEPLPDIDKKRHLYHFTSFDTFVKIWLTKELLFSDVRRVNDLIEQTIKWNFSNFLKIPLMGAIEDARYSYKQISLTMDYDSYLRGCMSSLMWGYYADKTNGVCIELDYDKLNLNENCLFGPVSYVNEVCRAIDVPDNISSRNDVEKWLVDNQQQFFFTKQITWKEENEFRIVSKSEKSLKIKDAITAVYVSKFDSDTCKFVLELVNGLVPVLCLSYVDSNGISIPCVTDAAAKLNQYEKAVKNENNCLNKMREQAESFYEKHKDDWDFPLILDGYRL